MQHWSLDELLSSSIEYLRGVPVWDAARTVEAIVAEWTTTLINRSGESIPDRVSQFVRARGIPRNWATLAAAELHWRVIYFEFHQMILGLRLSGEKAELRHRSELARFRLDDENNIRLLAQRLSLMSIPEALEWLEDLVRLWAISIDGEELRQQLTRQGYNLDHWSRENFLYYPIKLLAELTEA